MDSPADVALVSTSDATYYLAPRSYMDRISVTAVVASVLALAAVPFALASLPVVYGIISLAAVMLLAALASHATPDEPISPSSIDDEISRATYISLLAAHIELAQTLERAGERQELAERLLARSRDMVLACGRLAETANAASRYLDAHSAATAAADEARLHAQAAKNIPVTAAVLEAAARASNRQRTTATALDELRAHARARLELALASLRALTAAVVKRIACEAQAASGIDETLAACADELRDHTDAIETANAL